MVPYSSTPERSSCFHIYMVTLFSLEVTYKQGLNVGRQRNIVISAIVAKEEGLGGNSLCLVRTNKEFDSLKFEIRT